MVFSNGITLVSLSILVALCNGRSTTTLFPHLSVTREIQTLREAQSDKGAKEIAKIRETIANRMNEIRQNLESFPFDEQESLEEHHEQTNAFMVQQKDLLQQLWNDICLLEPELHAVNEATSKSDLSFSKNDIKEYSKETNVERKRFKREAKIMEHQSKPEPWGLLSNAKRD